jgi:murein DD-endopeptidase MepM/ murein hydrolase activator NlpD
VCVAMAWNVQWLRFPLPRAAALALTTIGLAACSGESSRFNENPFSGKNTPEATGSIQTASAAPVQRVESGPLPAHSAQYPASPPATNGAGAHLSSGVAGGGKGMASFAPKPAVVPPGAASSSDVTGAIATPRPAPIGNWSWDGGTAITVVSGDTIDSVARRYGVPAAAIMQANNLTAPATIHAGQQLVIPRYQAAARVPAASPKIVPVAATTTTAAAPAPPGTPGVHVVAPGETLSRISRLYGKPVGELAKANKITADTRLNVGDRLVIPGVRTSAGKLKPAAAMAEAGHAPSAPSQSAEPQQPSASVFTPVAQAPAADDTIKAAEGTGSLPKFRWPANGRVITAFGPTTNGQQNDGINIAVPENTPVKAAEDGVVAYAGNELKGYGNLVLVRHPNGYVTAYAHAKELLVKRGDQVKRGQVIARSGQSGNVNAPQLHFEIRKGASPVDPTKFLSGA